MGCKGLLCWWVEGCRCDMLRRGRSALLVSGLMVREESLDK